MKKILLFVVPVLFLDVGCEEEYGNCVIKGSTIIGSMLFTRYECYENVYSKKECMDKTKEKADINLSYNSYITESCSQFCADSPGNVCHEY